MKCDCNHESEIHSIKIEKNEKVYWACRESDCLCRDFRIKREPENKISLQELAIIIIVFIIALIIIIPYSIYYKAGEVWEELCNER